MINQQINLYQDRFKEIHPPMSALHGVVLVVLTLVVLAVSTGWYQHMQAESERSNQTALQQKQQRSEQLDALKAKLEALLADNPLELELHKVKQDIAVRKRMIDFVANNQLGAGVGFAGNLRALSEFSFADVWLNQITLAENFINLSGSALKAEKVPEYFAHLQERELFQGRVFDVFEVDRMKQTDWKLDFVIASRVAQ